MSRSGSVVVRSRPGLGNYLDRLVRGYVVDFLHLAHWPVFNVADAYVVAGAGLMAAMAWRARGTPARSRG